MEIYGDAKRPTARSPTRHARSGAQGSLERGPAVFSRPPRQRLPEVGFTGFPSVL